MERRNADGGSSNGSLPAAAALEEPLSGQAVMDNAMQVSSALQEQEAHPGLHETPSPAAKSDAAVAQWAPAAAGPTVAMQHADAHVLPDGTHQVRFADGSVYYGEWCGGRMHGRGVFVWPGGARYEGEWHDGQQDGTGTFNAPDHGTFYGSWHAGQMHGKCVFTPESTAKTGTYKAGAGAPGGPGQVVFLQQYDRGRLLSEQMLRVAHKDVRKKQQKKEGKKQAKREAKQLQAYHTPKPGEAVYKGHWSYLLMRELQLGITFGIAQAGLTAASGELREADFREETTQHFPPGAETPAFKWKDYAPRVFHRLRQEFGIDNSDYLLSVAGEAALRLLGSPGKSGSVFFLSDDDRFLVKTVGKEEMRLLLELIPRYYRHVRSNPGTMLVRFYGVHRVTPLLGRRVRFLVMGNVLPSDLRLHRRYDLKGSTHGRTAGDKERQAKPHATLKDLDVDMQLVLPAAQYQEVQRQLRRDLDLLERLRVIDYSLLLGVHFLRWGNDSWHPPFADWPTQAAAAAAEDGSGHAGAGAAPSVPHQAAAQAAKAAGLSGSEGDWGVASPAAVGALSIPDVLSPGGGPALPGATPQLTARGTLRRMWRNESINAANALAALIATTVQQQGQVEQAAAEQTQPAGAGGVSEDVVREERQYHVEQPPAQPAGSGQELEQRRQQQAMAAAGQASAAAAASLLQMAIQTRTQARLTAAAALQAADAAEAPAAAGLPPLPLLPSIAEASGAGDGTSSHARPISSSCERCGSGGSSSGSCSSAGAARAPAASVSADFAAQPPEPGGHAPDHPTAQAASTAQAEIGSDEQKQQSNPVAAAGHSQGLGSAAWPACLSGAPACIGDGDNGEIWARHPAPPPLPLFFLEDPGIASGATAGPKQRQTAENGAAAFVLAQAAAEEAAQVLEQGLDRTALGAAGGAALHKEAVLSSAGAGSKANTPLAAAATDTCALFMEQQEHVRRLVSLQGSGDAHQSVGRAVPAVAVRRRTGGELQCEPVLLFFGVIDFLQDYTLRKHLERWTKAAMFGGERVSVASPGAYSRRFLRAMQRVLVSSEVAEAGLCGCSASATGSKSGS